MRKWSLRSGKCKITFSETNGAINEIVFDGTRIAGKAEELLFLRLRARNGAVAVVNGSEFAAIEFDGDKFDFSEHSRYPGLSVIVAAHAVSGLFCFRPTVRGIPAGYRLELLDVPQVVVGANGELFHPRSEGGIIYQPAKKNYPPPEIDHEEFYIDNYPGRCQMQFMAHYRNGKGLYFAAHDSCATPKRIIYSGTGNGQKVRLRLETFCGTEDTSEYVSPFEYVLGGFNGDWMDACNIYRDWVEKAFELQVRTDLPEWMHDSPVTLIYPVCGDGTIKATPNEYFPYVNGMKYVSKFAAALDSRIMALLMRWDKNGPWLPPEIWPPLGGEKMLAEFRDRLHASGHLLGLYGSGTAWTLKSCTNTYDATTEFKQKHLENIMCRNADNSLCKGDMQGIRTGYFMCMTEAYPRKIVKSQIHAMANAGIDFLQYFDQNLGCNNYLCCAEDHSHVPVPGSWSTQSMLSLLNELNAELKTKGSSMILGTEGGAAEPYIMALPFNDLRSSLYFGSRPVPAYQYVFHQYGNNFMGNQVHMTHCLDRGKSPDNLLFRIAYSFSAGEMLSVPMRENGLIDWGNDGDWSLEPPEQESVIKLIKNLNRLRREYPQFLAAGRMVKPEIKLTGGKYTLWHLQRKIIFDRFMNSAWLSPSGEYVQIVTNFLPERIHISGNVPPNTVVHIGSRRRKRKFTLSVPPLSAIVLNLKSL